MIRSYDLAIDKENVERDINDPYLMIQNCRVGCSDGGFTTVTLHFRKTREPICRKRHRVIERFILFDGQNAYLDSKLEDERIRLLHKHEFITEQGVIIVLDYELKNG